MGIVEQMNAIGNSQPSQPYLLVELIKLFDNGMENFGRGQSIPCQVKYPPFLQINPERSLVK